MIASVEASQYSVSSTVGIEVFVPTSRTSGSDPSAGAVSKRVELAKFGLLDGSNSEPFRDSLFEQAKPKMKHSEIKRVRRIARLCQTCPGLTGSQFNMFAVVQIHHLLGSGFGSVSHRPLDAFSTGNAQSIAHQREASLLSPKNFRVGDTGSTPINVTTCKGLIQREKLNAERNPKIKPKQNTKAVHRIGYVKSQGCGRSAIFLLSGNSQNCLISSSRSATDRPKTVSKASSQPTVSTMG